MAILTSSLLLYLAAVLAVIFCVAYVYFGRNFNVWMKKGIPFLKPTMVVGNLKDVLFARSNMGEVLQNIYLEGKGKPYIGIFAFDQPMLLIRDVDIIKAVLVKDFNYFVDRNFQPNEESDPLFHNGLFALTGQRWRHIRMKLTPTFTSGKMKRMFQLVDACGQDLVTYLDKHLEDDCLEVKDTTARFTTDVIATCAFGIQGNALKDTNSEFRTMLKRIFEFSVFRNIKIAAAFFAPKLVSVFKLQLLDEDIATYLRNTIWNTVEEREKSGIVRKDFLDLLIQLKKDGHVNDDTANGKDTDKLELDGDDFVAQSFTFLTAGFETSSTTMSFALYELALHPNVQQRLREEICAVLDRSNQQLTYEGVQEMTYLDMVVAETLRKYPVLPFLDRRAAQLYTLPGSSITLDQGQVVLIPVLGLHMDPNFYPQPERFDPERFTEANKRTRPHYAYLPFGEGPRNCIGNRMGLMQAKVGLVHMLSQFQVSPSKHTPVPLKLDPKSFLLTAKGGLPLSFRRVK